MNLEEIKKEFNKEIKPMFTDYVVKCVCGHRDHEHHNFDEYCYYENCDCREFKLGREEEEVDQYILSKIWNFIVKILTKN